MRGADVVSTVLDVVGALMLVAFAFFIWPPAALAAAGGLCLLVSWQMSRRGGRP